MLQIVGLSIKKKKLSAVHIILIITFLCNFFLLRYYWGERHVVYFSYFHPFIYLFCGEVFLFLWGKKYLSYVATISLIIILSLALHDDLPYLQPSGFYQQYTNEAAALQHTFPGHKLQLYTCKAGVNDVRARAASLLLSQTSQHGSIVKIGFINGGGKCPFPDSKAILLDPHDQRPWYEIAYPAVPGIHNILVFDNASDAALAKAGWKEISVEDIYNEAARWWFTEQP